MTEKDYERAAWIVQDRVEAAGPTLMTETTLVLLTEAFAEFFYNDGNPHFDVDRFRRACVPGANVKAITRS